LHVNTELFLRLAQKHVWSLLPQIITPLTVFNCSGKYSSQKENYFYLGLFFGWVTCSWNSFLKHWWSWSLALLLHTIFTDISLSSCKIYHTYRLSWEAFVALVVFCTPEHLRACDWLQWCSVYRWGINTLLSSHSLIQNKLVFSWFSTKAKWPEESYVLQSMSSML